MFVVVVDVIVVCCECYCWRLVHRYRICLFVVYCVLLLMLFVDDCGVVVLRVVVVCVCVWLVWCMCVVCFCI